MSVVAWMLAADLLITAGRARREAIAQAVQGVREADRYLAWIRLYGGPHEVQAAQQLADAWRDYRESL
jgi:hypothetical protein